MNAPVPCYLADPAGGPAAFTLLHTPREPGTTGVLLCPPFGYDDICTYRPLRAWAIALADSGHPTLRLELPGTGDAEGDEHSERLVEAWVRSIATAAAHLRAATGCARVVAVGIGLGAILAHEAVAHGAAIDDLVLWGTHARGRSFVRELRAFARLGAIDDAEASWALPLPDGAVEAGGFLLAAETVAGIEALDLSTATLPEAGRRRVLLLRRDRSGPDGRLAAALEASGAGLTVADGPGFTALMDEPNRSRAPTATFAVVERWLQDTERPAEALPASPEPVEVAADTQLVAAAGYVERALSLPAAAGQLFAVETRPAGDDAAPVCVVFLDVGAERRIGANRMWVAAARRWAERGVPSARIDLLGIGDADGEDAPYHDVWTLYHEELVDQVESALAGLVEAGLPPRFVMVGMCSSAYWGFRVALRDPRVVATCLLNPRMLLFDETRGSAREVRQLRRLARAETWRDLLRGRLTRRRSRQLIDASMFMLARLPRIVLDRILARARGGDALDLAFDTLRDQGTVVHVAFTPTEPLREELVRSGHLLRLDRWPNLKLVALDGPENAHTMQFVALQPPAHRTMDATIEAGLAASGGATPAPPSGVLG